MQEKTDYRSTKISDLQKKKKTFLHIIYFIYKSLQ